MSVHFNFIRLGRAITGLKMVHSGKSLSKGAQLGGSKGRFRRDDFSLRL